MKSSICLLTVVVGIALCYPMPQKDGAAYTNEAIRQAQNQKLLPANAKIEQVQESIPLAAYEQIPGSQRIVLSDFLSSENLGIPQEVVNNLQEQIDKISS